MDFNYFHDGSSKVQKNCSNTQYINSGRTDKYRPRKSKNINPPSPVVHTPKAAKLSKSPTVVRILKRGEITADMKPCSSPEKVQQEKRDSPINASEIYTENGMKISPYHTPKHKKFDVTTVRVDVPEVVTPKVPLSSKLVIETAGTDVEESPITKTFAWSAFQTSPDPKTLPLPKFEISSSMISLSAQYQVISREVNQDEQKEADEIISSKQNICIKKSPKKQPSTPEEKYSAVVDLRKVMGLSN